MKPIVKMLFGSHVYGTNTPTSDTDYKGVFIPNIRDVLLGRAPKTSIVQSTGSQFTKNSSEDVDMEMFSLAGYLRVAQEGQVVALDMLFAPEQYWEMVDPLWHEIRANKDKILCKETTAYVGYCRKQAGKYGIRGSRVGEVRDLLNFLDTCSPKAKLFEYIEKLTDFLVGKEFTSIIEVDAGQNIGGGGIKNQWAGFMIECCNRKCTLTNTVSSAREMYKKLFDAYGERALMAEKNEGVDWKAMHHATRCCYEAVELLDTHNITFPLHQAEHLLDIKQGKLDYTKVAEDLEELMVEVERAKERSTLPEKPDYKWAEDFITETYLKNV